MFIECFRVTDWLWCVCSIIISTCSDCMFSLCFAQFSLLSNPTKQPPFLAKYRPRVTKRGINAHFWVGTVSLWVLIHVWYLPDKKMVAVASNSTAAVRTMLWFVESAKAYVPPRPGPLRCALPQTCARWSPGGKPGRRQRQCPER